MEIRPNKEIEHILNAVASILRSGAPIDLLKDIRSQSIMGDIKNIDKLIVEKPFIYRLTGKRITVEEALLIAEKYKKGDE